MSLILLLGVSATMASIIVSVIAVVLLAICYNGLILTLTPNRPPYRYTERHCFGYWGCLVAVFLAEGAVLDWGAVFLIEHHGLEETLGGLGFGCFATTMTIGRLLGRQIVRRVGSSRVVFLGALLACPRFCYC